MVNMMQFELCNSNLTCATCKCALALVYFTPPQLELFQISETVM